MAREHIAKLLIFDSAFHPSILWHDSPRTSVIV